MRSIAGYVTYKKRETDPKEAEENFLKKIQTGS